MKPRGPVKPGERANTPNGAPFPLRSWPPDAAIDIQNLAEWVDPLGMWQAYTPTIGGALTIGNGVVTARYTRIGRTVHFRTVIRLGSSSAMGNGVVTQTFPSPVANGFYALVELLSQGNNTWTGSISGGGIALISPTTHTSALFSSTTPFTWKANDEIRTNGTYEST